MAPSAPLLLLLTCLILCPLISALTMNVSTDHHQICSSTPFPELCIDSLKLSISISINPKIISFALRSLEAAFSAVSDLSPLLASASFAEAQRGALQDCRELHSSTLSSLLLSTSLLRSGSEDRAVADARTHLSAALTNRNTCLEGLSGTRGPLAEALINALTAAYRHVSNSLSLVSQSAGGERRRRRLEARSTQNWLRRRERLLLENGDYSTYDASAMVTVAADGSGNFTTVGEAVTFAPNSSADRTIIILRSGVYDENVEIPSYKTNIALLGEGSDMTFIRGNRSVGDGWTTFRSATVEPIMSGFLGRTKKTFSKNRRESSGSSSQPEIHVEEEAPELPVQEEAQVGVQQHPQDEGIYLINSEGAFVRRRGRATCRDIKKLPHGTRVNIDVNDDGIPCNYPETNLLASYMGVIVKDSIIAPISFADWRNPGMEPYNKLMATEVEAKFAYPTHICPWIRNSLGVKWRNYKTSLKNKYWDGRPIEEVINNVPEGVDHLQWATLVTRWNEPRDKERAAQNTRNAQQQKCPHTMGRTSEVRRQQETMTQDRLLLWKMNRLHKDGSWTSDDVRQKWEMACQMLAASGLTPEDENVEENERVLKDVMGAEHPGRVRCKGFGVTPSKYHPQSSTSTGCSSAGPSGNVRYEQRFTRLEGDVGEIKGMMTKMFELINKKSKGKKKNDIPSDNTDEEGTDS